jgi:hypothetical protein
MLEKGFGLEPYNTVFQSENSGITANKEAENEYDEKVRKMILKYIIEENTTSKK